eukprot:TRINITY_DN14205_c0_g1_i1.p1 TRINITY_DN14205_c0_g1~~TRINITY_DN14205_c0_g1_i1.p1  ORF type:complete len:859 (+),score=148.47 TRINITY_DN14205_c0_g1_i1:51-2627(+)
MALPVQPAACLHSTPRTAPQVSQPLEGDRLVRYAAPTAMMVSSSTRPAGGASTDRAALSVGSQQQLRAQSALRPAQHEALFLRSDAGAGMVAEEHRPAGRLTLFHRRQPAAVQLASAASAARELTPPTQRPAAACQPQRWQPSASSSSSVPSTSHAFCQDQALAGSESSTLVYRRSSAHFSDQRMGRQTPPPSRVCWLVPASAMPGAEEQRSRSASSSRFCSIPSMSMPQPSPLRPPPSLSVSKDHSQHAWLAQSAGLLGPLSSRFEERSRRPSAASSSSEASGGSDAGSGGAGAVEAEGDAGRSSSSKAEVQGPPCDSGLPSRAPSLAGAVSRRPAPVVVWRPPAAANLDGVTPACGAAAPCRDGVVSAEPSTPSCASSRSSRRSTLCCEPATSTPSPARLQRSPLSSPATSLRGERGAEAALETCDRLKGATELHSPSPVLRSRWTQRDAALSSDAAPPREKGALPHLLGHPCNSPSRPWKLAAQPWQEDTGTDGLQRTPEMSPRPLPGRRCRAATPEPPSVVVRLFEGSVYLREKKGASAEDAGGTKDSFLFDCAMVASPNQLRGRRGSGCSQLLDSGARKLRYGGYVSPPPRASRSPSPGTAIMRKRSSLVERSMVTSIKRLCQGELCGAEAEAFVEEQLFESLPAENVKQLQIEPIARDESREAFVDAVRRGGGLWSRVRVTWHLAGSSQAAASIVEGGIRCDEENCACGRYGKGGYVALSAAKANAYADSCGLGGSRQLFMVLALPDEEVVLGKKGLRPERTAADLPSHPTEYCFVDASRLHCVFQLSYDWVPTGRREKVTTAVPRVSHVVPTRASSPQTRSPTPRLRLCRGTGPSSGSAAAQAAESAAACT